MEFNRYSSGVLWADDAVAWICEELPGGKVHKSLGDGTEDHVNCIH